MNKTALKYTSCDDLMHLARKLDALGTAVGHLSFHNSEFFDDVGQEFGAIISDYGSVLENILSDHFWDIDRILRYGDSSLLSELKEDQKTIEEGSMGLHGNLRIAREAIKKVDDFLNENFKQLMDMSAYFGDVARDISRQLMGKPENKEAPAKADHQAEASGLDQDISENVNELSHQES